MKLIIKPAQLMDTQRSAVKTEKTERKETAEKVPFTINQIQTLKKFYEEKLYYTK